MQGEGEIAKVNRVEFLGDNALFRLAQQPLGDAGDRGELPDGKVALDSMGF